MDYVLILGAKSDIAKAIAYKYAKNGYSLYLAARNSNELEEFASDIKIRNQVEVNCLDFDILDYDSHLFFYNSLLLKPICVISVVGLLGVQKDAQNYFGETAKIINSNFTGVVSILNIIANDFEKKKRGSIIGISSVAGDRGRKSNYIYGSAKAAFSTYLSGLRNRLSSSNVHVMTVKPGFVATKMTRDMDLPKKMTAQPDEVAEDIFRAQLQGKNILYTKWFWKWIMLFINHIPEWKFKKINL